MIVEKEYLERESFNSEETLKRLKRDEELCKEYRAKVDILVNKEPSTFPNYKASNLNWLSRAKDLYSAFGFFKFPLDDKCVLPPGESSKELIPGVKFVTDIQMLHF